MNDRESHGLRGTVQRSIETTVYPPAAGPDGKLTPEIKRVHETEFDAEGRLTTMRNRSANGSGWVREQVYDVAGRLQRITIQNGSSPRIDQVYTYGDDGRLLKITNSEKPDNPAIYQYDERGRKTMLQISRPEDFEGGGIVCGSPFMIAAEAPNFPGGGSSLVSFDEFDRPYEVEVRGATGEVVTRAFRIYDEHGRVVEERAEVENIVPALPLELQKAMIWPHNREKIQDAFGGRKNSSVHYTYDNQGHPVRIKHGDGRVHEMKYNLRGDCVTENMGWGSETLREFIYDPQGNWIEQQTFNRSIPDGALQPSGKRRRELTYY
jgi:YD repeat-containing protein